MKFLNTFLPIAAFTQERCGEIKLGEKGQFAAVSLSSYPGSGNTWVRYMIEEFTGYYTGSVFNDGKLYRGGFMGEYEEYQDGRVIVTKAHTFRSERPLTDAIMLIRNPYDAFLSEFNRVNGAGVTGNDHTGQASLEDFISSKWTDMNFAKYAGRWFRLYSGLLGSGYKMLPVIYEEIKADPIREMERIVEFLETRTDYEAKYDCLFGDNSKRFKRSSDRAFDPYDFVDNEKLVYVNEVIMEISESLNRTYGITLPESYLRDLH
ncbi:unnamed protein product [Oikopleura dioica]|uniref:Sulfotransferase n=1 Tax=Oikopleura dioica TaxID=34765 RepID=E4X3H6_OIKDI|nr:unnamed protein product [Oikopleura dioica]